MDTVVVLSNPSFINTESVKDSVVAIESSFTVLVTTTSTDTVVTDSTGNILQSSVEYHTPVVGGMQSIASVIS